MPSTATYTTLDQAIFDFYSEDSLNSYLDTPAGGQFLLTPNTVDSGIDSVEIQYSLVVTAGGTYNGRGILGLVTHNVASGQTNGGAVTGIQGQVTKSGSGTATFLHGLRGQLTVLDGTATNGYGMRGVVDVNSSATCTNVYAIQSTTVGDGTATVDNAFGIHVGAVGSMGSLTTSYGVFVEPSTEAVTNYSFYAAGSSQIGFFGGILLVGSSSTIGNGPLRIYSNDGFHINCRADGGQFRVQVNNSNGDTTLNVTAGKLVLQSTDGVQIGNGTGTALLQKISQESVTLTAPASVAAQSTSTFTHTMASGTVDSGSRVFVSMKTTLDAGLTWDYTYNNSTRVLTIRYTNVTGSAIVPATGSPQFDILKVQF